MKYLRKLTIRDLLWLTLLAAIGLGWWRDNTQLTDRQRQLTAGKMQLIEEKELWKSRASGLKDEVEFEWTDKGRVPSNVRVNFLDEGLEIIRTGDRSVMPSYSRRTSGRPRP